MLDWLSLHHLLSCHHLSTPRLVITLPLYAAPSSLPQLVVASPCRCHCLSTRQLVVTLPLIALPSCLPHLVVPAPIVAPPPLIALAGCHVASHHATLSINLADCCVTPCCRHHHPSKSRRHPTVHYAVATVAHCDCAANVESHRVSILPSFPLPPPTIMAIAMQHIMILLPFHRCCTTSAGADAAAAAAGGTAALLLLLPLGTLWECFPCMKPHELLLAVLHRVAAAATKTEGQ
jgi:hypothetical protein